MISNPSENLLHFVSKIHRFWRFSSLKIQKNTRFPLFGDPVRLQKAAGGKSQIVIDEPISKRFGSFCFSFLLSCFRKTASNHSWQPRHSRLQTEKNGFFSEFDLTKWKSVVNYNPVALGRLKSRTGGALEKNRKIFRNRFDKCGKHAIFHPHASPDPERLSEAVLKKI